MSEARERAAQRLVGMMAGDMRLHQSMRRGDAKGIAIEALTDKAVDILIENEAQAKRITELEALHKTYYNQPFAEVAAEATRQERERIIATLGTAFLNYTAHDPEKGLFMVGTDNIRHALGL